MLAFNDWHIHGVQDRIHFLNLYVAYKDRALFRKWMEDHNVLKIGSLIMVRYFNVTLPREKCCGDRCRGDPLANHLQSLLESNNLLDIRPLPLSQTYFNGRTGDAHIGKRWDQFFVHENLVEGLGNMKTWVVRSHISDHLPIVLQWR